MPMSLSLWAKWVIVHFCALDGVCMFFFLCFFPFWNSIYTVSHPHDARGSHLSKWVAGEVCGECECVCVSLLHVCLCVSVFVGSSFHLLLFLQLLGPFQSLSAISPLPCSERKDRTKHSMFLELNNYKLKRITPSSLLSFCVPGQQPRVHQR